MSNVVRGKPGEQKIAELPADRTLDGTPFANYGVDMFGLLFIKKGRGELEMDHQRLTIKKFNTFWKILALSTSLDIKTS